MLDRNSTDVSIFIEIPKRVLVQVACLGDFRRLELDVEGVGVLEIADLHGSKEQSRKAFFAARAQEERLTDADRITNFVCMRTTLNIQDELLAEAGKLAGTGEKTALVRMGLEALIEREAARRLARMGGAMPRLKLAPRSRTAAGRR